MPAYAYTWSDAWLLFSVMRAASGASDGATLEAVVAVGDWVNHAIFTFSEVDGGLGRLARGGLVTIDGSRVLPTSAAVAMYEKASGKRGGVRKIMARLERELDAMSSSVDGEQPSTDSQPLPPSITESEFQRACTQYVQRMNTLMHGRKKRRMT